MDAGKAGNFTSSMKDNSSATPYALSGNACSRDPFFPGAVLATTAAFPSQSTLASTSSGTWQSQCAKWPDRPTLSARARGHAQTSPTYGGTSEYSTSAGPRTAESPPSISTRNGTLSWYEQVSSSFQNPSSYGADPPMLYDYRQSEPPVSYRWNLRASKLKEKTKYRLDEQVKLRLEFEDTFQSGTKTGSQFMSAFNDPNIQAPNFKYIVVPATRSVKASRHGASLLIPKRHCFSSNQRPSSRHTGLFYSHS
jgi:hypothetical protein